MTFTVCLNVIVNVVLLKYITHARIQKIFSGEHQNPRWGLTENFNMAKTNNLAIPGGSGPPAPPPPPLFTLVVLKQPWHIFRIPSPIPIPTPNPTPLERSICPICGAYCCSIDTALQHTLEVFWYLCFLYAVVIFCCSIRWNHTARCTLHSYCT